VEYIAEHDDEVLDKYLTEGTLSLEEMRKSIRKSTLALKIVPVLAGSAFKNKGIQPLLDAVIDFLPSPTDVPPVEGVNPEDDETVLRRAADDQPFCRAGVQDYVRPVRRARDLHSRVFGCAEVGQLCVQLW
jgi:elongation factor G